MTRIEFDQLASDGRVPCPDCGSSQTRPYPNCGCPKRDSGYGTMHINKWHHACKVSFKTNPTKEEEIVKPKRMLRLRRAV